MATAAEIFLSWQLELELEPEPAPSRERLLCWTRLTTAVEVADDSELIPAGTQEAVEQN